jgi:hypothetical protein
MAMTTGFQVEGLKEAAAHGWTQVVNTVACPRCQGLLVPEPLLDLLEDSGQAGLAARRCVQCGEVIDPIILRNRYRQRAVGPGTGPGGAGLSRSQEGS